MPALRPALKPYTRSTDGPLRVATSSDDTARSIPERRAVWSDYLGVGPGPAGTTPMATSWIPLVIGAEVTDAGDGAGPAGDETVLSYVPGSFYPAGFRRQVLAGCGLTEDPVVTDPSNGVGSWLLPRLEDVRSLPDAELVRCALTLNLLSQYTRTVRIFGPLTAERDIPRLFREVARAWYAAGRSGAEQTGPFKAIAESESWDPLSRVGAAIRLIAHYSRSARDVEQAAHWCRTAERLHQDADDGSFTWRLYGSHLDRALALHHWRRRDAAAMSGALRSAAASAVRLQDETADVHMLLSARHAERLVREAELKAFTGFPRDEDAATAQQIAERIGALDPTDPYSALIAGDTHWILGDDDRALDRYGVAARAGTLLGAQAAAKAAAVHRAGGSAEHATEWDTVAAELDDEAA